MNNHLHYNTYYLGTLQIILKTYKLVFKMDIMGGFNIAMQAGMHQNCLKKK